MEIIIDKKKTKENIALTGLDTSSIYMSLTYPFIRTVNDGQLVFVFKKNKMSQNVDKIYFGELPSKIKHELKIIDKSRRFYFALTCIGLVATFFISYFLFRIAIALIIATTGYDILNRRIKFLWLNREYKRNIK